MSATRHDGLTRENKTVFINRQHDLLWEKTSKHLRKLLAQYIAFFQLHTMQGQYAKVDCISTHQQLELALNKIHLE